MQSGNPGNFKYVFVCGVGRSGTSVLGRNIARLENCTGFKNTGVLEDEGQFLQDIYPTDHQLGGAGRFGFHPRAHLTESSALLTAENISKLHKCWHSYWDDRKKICVEKTPSNLLMTRFLQKIFPESYFIVLRRHPVPVSIATQRWKVSITPLHKLFEHWLHCYELFERDRKYLAHVYELTYEDYIQNPAKYHREIAAFIGTRIPEASTHDKFRYVTQFGNPGGLRVPEYAMEEVTDSHNKRYFERWSNLLTHSTWKGYYRYIARKYDRRFKQHGYSLVDGIGLPAGVLNRGRKMDGIIGPRYCFWAEIGAFLQRVWAWTPWYAKQKAKAWLPAFVVTRLRRSHQNPLMPEKESPVVSR